MALFTRSVLVSLFGGIVLGLFLLNDFSFVDTFYATFTLFFTLLSQAWILKTLGFALLVGSIVILIENSGGIGGFIHFVQKKHSIITSARASLLLAYFIGILIFVESSITSLIAGTVSRPLTDSHGVSRAKLAFVCDSTSAPVCSLLAINGWGALLLGLISTQILAGVLVGESIDILLKSIAYNFYAMSALVVTFLVIWFNIDIGPMKNAVVINDPTRQYGFGKIGHMVYPIILMVVLVFLFLYITGDGNILKGSGSSSIFYTMIVTTLFSILYYKLDGVMSIKRGLFLSFEGIKKMIPIATILLFAFAIGNVTDELKTGLYLASFASNILSVHYLALIIFVLSSIMSFSTGTSWGTFSIMTPIAIPMAVAMGADIPLVIGAVISGGVFGDHCSPISDTTIISAMASECDVVEHVKTQLPYALISGLVASVMFVIFSYM
ncbi:Na+/H+ antiporter NhaC family protein [Sulfurimonas sp. HSL3-2]|uniref:Na+/H+ antiporter NhaC family protein n=1 Tax=Hydrocurvibacter mobilis TaxID=3131936 RepID=UPI0031F911BD